MSDSSSVTESLDLMKILTDCEDEIDDNDEDFKYVLKCLCQMPVDEIKDQTLDTHTTKTKKCKAADATKKIKNIEDGQKHPRMYEGYPDFSKVPDDAVPEKTYKNMRGRCQETFPTKLYKILRISNDGGYSHIISWLPHGRAFKIHSENLFEKHIMKKYFYQSKIDSFKHQLYSYGFKKIGQRFIDCGGYCHELFIRGRLGLCDKIERIEGKGSARFCSQIPNFYEMPQIDYHAKGENHDERNAKSDCCNEPKQVCYEEETSK